MGGFITFLIIVYIIYKVFIEDSLQNPTPPAPPSTLPTPSKPHTNNQTARDNAFQARINLGKVESFDTFELELKGDIKLQQSLNNIIIFQVEMKDVTDGKNDYIVTHMESLSASDAPVFLYSSEPLFINSKIIPMDDWLKLLVIPVEGLVFPYKGIRKIKFTVKVLDYRNNQLNTVITTTKTITHQVAYVGYLEKGENQSKYEKIVIGLALEIAYADGTISDSEKAFIKEKVISRLNSDKDRQKELMEFLNKKLSDIMQYPGQPEDRIKKLSQELKKVADEQEISTAMEILLKLASVDSILDVAEDKAIHLIAKELNVSLEKLTDLMSKFVPVNLFDKEDQSKKLLNMEHLELIEDKKDYLRQQYKKWNPLTTSSDPDTRSQAEQMLKLIAIERAKLERVTT